MKDKELKLNASGYKDEPCYQTIKAVDVPKPGEIYIHGDTGRYVLVLNCVNGVCAILNLTEQEREDRIPVMVRVKMYTNPIMITYAFTSALAQYVKTITDDEFTAIKSGVADALGIADMLEEKAKALEDELKALKTRNDGLERSYNMILVKEINSVEKCNELRIENENLKAELEGKKQSCAESNAAMIYKEMYMTLLDKVISVRGCVNE